MKNLILFLILFPNLFLAQDDLTSEFITDDKLVSLLHKSNEGVNSIVNFYEEGNKAAALNQLAAYFKEKMSSSYFFDWKTFDDRFETYSRKYPSKLNDHLRRKDEHLALYSAKTEWKRPMTGLNGREITAYLLRHLARQHKMLDVGFSYYLDGKNPEYIDYFTGQVASLYEAYLNNEYEQEGNDVFEYYRAGYRMFNWLFVHNMFLPAEDYSAEDQILLIKTFLYHGADLYNKTKKYNKGNHHTKGLVGLAQIAILFSEFKITELWLEHSVTQLTQHLQNEINSDGFQFERSMHYHVGDIDNYFYVYYLAQINNIELPEEFVKKFRSMFDAIVKVAMPNKKLPVLQDDTDSPLAEYNSMESPMFIGTLLFNDPAYKYFSGNKIPSKKFWYVRDRDVESIKSVKKEQPEYSSLSLDETGYYVMRTGWDKNDPYMIISAGRSETKPDHQHGDMMGLYAYANSQVILPNYQVRYFLEDYNFFKNSFVKNVALVDSIQLGREWKGNTGGSGFGKFRQLPNPETLVWKPGKNFDLYIGSHDAYDEIGVDYFRKVLFVKDGFWIVKDEFCSNSEHEYQQVWQGHYNIEFDESHLRTTFSDGSGLDVYQLSDNDYTISYGKFRGKGNSIVSRETSGDFSFVTLLSPFAHFEERLIPEEEKLINLHGWNYFKSVDGFKINAEIILNKKNNYIVFEFTDLQLGNLIVKADKSADIIFMMNKDDLEITSLNAGEVDLSFPEKLRLKYDGVMKNTNRQMLKPGEKIILYTN